jgi:hypothetical protein
MLKYKLCFLLLITCSYLTKFYYYYIYAHLKFIYYTLINRFMKFNTLKKGMMIFKVGLMIFKMGLGSNDLITYYTLMLKYSLYRPRSLNKLLGDLCRKNVYAKTYGVKLYLEPCEDPPIYSIFISIMSLLHLGFFSFCKRRRCSSRLWR